ncbi:MAG TPA: single-stranded DNA-binding protein [Bacillus sp. (in: firmicutes)]|uniref:single-stranded DNA-binding protein n=1 Tax=Bacillus litorisediminis TaxID=2922713 RepID=UPI001FABB661|nr:single-stranded DNA-binding protein [Bacillus litorisediminis]HWO78188.1 single-stranded DNA-binding protein [Bacillus sp. (in: firmicutes)]
MLNQVTLVGRLTRDPEVRRTPEGTAVTNVTIAINRHFRNQQGEIEADFVPCTIWRKAAENTAQYCKKGSLVGVIGKIQTRFYENQEGKRVYVTEVVADSIQFIDTRSSKQSREPANGSTNETAQAEPKESIEEILFK